VIADFEGGTLFLDDVEAPSFRGQVSLLRFLQDRQYRSWAPGAL
jgi:DNA-binding NtrC family response regulator